MLREEQRIFDFPNSFVLAFLSAHKITHSIQCILIGLQTSIVYVQ